MAGSTMQFETFEPLTKLGVVTHAFTLRCDDDTRIDDYEKRLVQSLGFPTNGFASAEQPHGNGVAVVVAPTPGRIPGVDALVTRVVGLLLIIRCADCAAVYIVDRTTPAIALIHSGKKGTQANVAGATLTAMRQHFDTQPIDCLAVISPSIGPCHYEVDIGAGIERQLRKAGVTDILNTHVCTACHLDRYYSYRAERGQTGRMLAALALRLK